MTTISGFIQALVTAKEEPPVWFLVVIGLIIAMLVGVGIYVIMMGRKKPPAKKPEPAPKPEIEAKEAFIREMLAQGHSQRGLYPMGPEMEKEFERWRAERARD